VVLFFDGLSTDGKVVVIRDKCLLYGISVVAHSKASMNVLKKAMAYLEI